MKAIDVIKFPWEQSTLSDRCQLTFDLEPFTAKIEWLRDGDYGLSVYAKDPGLRVSLYQRIPASSLIEARGSANVILTIKGFTPWEG